MGANLIQIRITAPDGTGNTYTVTVNWEDVMQTTMVG
ncbi:hypothetical protein [Paenibacillus ferrarius]